MRARYKAPAGTGIVQLADEATLKDLIRQLASLTGVQYFDIKYGPPTGMKSVNMSQIFESVTSLGLNGETLTVVPREAVQPSIVSPQAPIRDVSVTGFQMPSEPKEEGPEDVNVPWPEREGTLLLRVMPSDNSCLFTAFGGALPQQIPAQKLRQMMAEYITEHSDVYSEAILGSRPSQYCRSIQDPDRWGGGIELSILSAIFNVQICTFDVQGQNLMSFGEEKPDRCILVYSGIHYDRVAFSYSDPPHSNPMLPPEMDRTRWETTDDEVLEKTQQLIRKLNASHYYTDTEGLVLKCDVSGCEWIGSGQREGQRHAEQTGHIALTEIRDEGEDNTLRTCDSPDCTFMGQGNKPMMQHRQDTGHQRFSVIPDC